MCSFKFKDQKHLFPAICDPPFIFSPSLSPAFLHLPPQPLLSSSSSLPHPLPHMEPYLLNRNQGSNIR